LYCNQGKKYDAIHNMHPIPKIEIKFFMIIKV
jgi:hypothetical protein